MSTQAVPGYNGLVYVSSDGGSTYTKIGELKNVTLSFNIDELDGRSHDSGGYYDPVFGSRKWTADAEVLNIVTDAGQAAIVAALSGATTLFFRFDPYGTAVGKPRRTGSGVITSWDETQPNSDLSACKIKIAGKGALTFSTQ